MLKHFTMASKIAACLFLMVHSARAQALLDPPFGLRWGDSPEKLIAWASEHEMNVTITLPGKQHGLKILHIAPESGFLPGSKASAVEGRFLDAKLFEIAIHYTDPEVSADVIEARFEELKKQITLEHGKLLANQQQRTVKDQFATRTLSFHREPVKGLFLLMVFSEVEDLLRKTKEARFSLIYRNDNFRQELEAELRKP